MTPLARCAAVLSLVILTTPLFGQSPRFFNQAGCGGAGSLFSPFAPSGAFGGPVPRLFPSFGGGFFGPPLISIGIGTPIFPSPIFSSPFLTPPYLFSPPIEPIEILAAPNAAPANHQPLRGQPAGRFRPVGPLDRDRARMAAPVPVNPPPPEDPSTAYARLVREAKRAFGDGEYGRAAELLQKAVVIFPIRAEGRLLLAQAWIALGKYAEAAAAIHRGVRLEPDWPESGPHISAIYGVRRADFELHRQLLDDAAKLSPDDATLQFLSAYVAWFDDREDEARRIFEALRPRVADSAVIDLFLAEP